jgi:phosphonate transport system substrate-binding protein
MKGKVFGFGDPNSTSGYLIPSVEIPENGYSMEPGDYFGDIKFTGGHEQTIVASSTVTRRRRDLGRRPGQLGRRL